MSGLTELTIQGAFDGIVSYFSKPGAKLAQVDPNSPDWKNGPRCRYRTPDGDKCAVGCLIPDERYEPWFDQTGSLGDVTGVVWGFAPVDRNGVRLDLYTFLDHAQSAHDGAVSVEEFLTALKTDVAPMFGLEVPS